MTAKRASKGKPPGQKVGQAKRASPRKASKTAAKGAERTAAKVKATGAKGKRLPAAKARLRDTLIVQRAAQGWTNAMIAAEAGITERSVERILKEQRSVPNPLDESPLALVRDLVQQFRLMIGDYEAMALAFMEPHPSAALGAKNAARETRAQLLAILQTLGHTPDLAALRVPMEAGQIGRVMVDAVDAFEGQIDGLVQQLDEQQGGALLAAVEGLRAAFAEMIGDPGGVEVVDAEPVGELMA